LKKRTESKILILIMIMTVTRTKMDKMRMAFLRRVQLVLRE